MSVYQVSVVLAIVLIIFANLMSMWITNEHFSFQNLSQLHASNPLIWMFYAILGGFVWAARYYTRCIRKKEKLDKDNQRMREIQDKAMQYSKELEEGNLDAELDIRENTSISQVLINLRDKMKQNELEAIKRQKEDEQRNWISEGVAMFNDILRKDKGNDLYELSYHVISNLVKYLDVNQGGLFILHEEESEDPDQQDSSNQEQSQSSYFELAASYAFNRRKYKTKSIEWGEGLVGTCAIEKESIYMSEIPQDYIYITSGLGEANPNYLFIVPLKLEDKVHGVIELASFKPIEQYQRNFVERIGESVASTLSSIKINQRTNELLRKSQQQAEELASQEEELRQNMEEMQTTQESLEQSQAKSKMIFENVMDAIITIDENGLIDQFNPSAEKIFGYSADEVAGKNVKMLMPGKHAKQHDTYINRYLRTGEKHIIGKAREEEGITKDGTKFPVELRVEEVWLENKRLFLGMIRDITERKKAEEEVRQQMEEIRSRDEELKQNIEELRATQDSLQEKDEQQKKEIEELNAENQRKLERLEQMKEAQKKKDEETKQLYEGEIELMFNTWMSQLEKAEKKLTDHQYNNQRLDNKN
ncbi:MAG: PAS domain S-box protein [Bacteroidales bacterium]|nr:PAS domain S-box protein [Bacteroidales bacterium]